MEIRNLYQQFELDFIEVDEYQTQKYKNTFFEMVFVLEGTGTHIINNHRLPYAKNKLFLIFPQDTQGFEVEETTQFFFIRFNENYLKTQSREWVQKLEFIFHNHNHSPSCILKTITDKPLVRSIVEALIRERDAPQAELEVIKQLMNTIITIAARNVLLIPPVISDQAKSDQAMHLIQYIHQHIYDTDKLKSKKIAEAFNLSPTYISTYFKTQTGQTLQDYIISYKLKVVETRLKFTDMQINEIVNELGFTDASHLNRQFKKHYQMSPSEYRSTL